MKGEFTAVIEEAPEGGYWAMCPEVPGANGQGETVDEAKSSLRDASTHRFYFVTLETIVGSNDEPRVFFQRHKRYASNPCTPFS